MPKLKGFDPALPDHHTGVGRKSMFEEVESTTRSKYASYLCQHGVGVGNRAQSESAQGVVAAVVGEGNRLSVESDALDGDRSIFDALPRNPNCRRRGLDGKDSVDIRWVAIDVEARTEPGLEDSSRQPSRHFGPPPSETACPAALTHQPGKDVLAVEAHFAKIQKWRRQPGR